MGTWLLEYIPLITIYYSVCMFSGNRNEEGGTCKGDSGGPLLVDTYDKNGITVVQEGVLHGGAATCSNKKFPAIFNRISTPSIYDWIFGKIFTGKAAS